MTGTFKEKIQAIAAKYLVPSYYGYAFPFDADNPLSVTPEEGEYIHDFILDKGIESAIEIGTGTGYSGLYMATALKNLYTIDNGSCFTHLEHPREELRTLWESMCEDMGLTNIKFLWRDEPFELPKVDMLFIDGAHGGDLPYQDFVEYSPHLKDKHWVLWHDWDITFVRDSVAKTGYNYKLISLPHTYGLVIAEKK